MMGYYSVGVIDNVQFDIKGKEISIQFKGTSDYSMIGPEQKEYNLFVNSSGEKLDICPLDKSKELRVFNSCDNLMEIFYKLYKNKQLIQIHINDENKVVEWKTVNGYI